ncbi:glycerophosphodiester phosphodiesterase family protein [Roseicyclus marinus]|uniref:glycerophosphodiester phosphodiesterase family protein n=1 Tax=Roseicyclus marinus TaxID=2161673 RepID=UPI00240F310F|nr:glycerophosphodiester phosphodiesterase family protein [Roseicyclus marinus]MDG3041321.1 glycerophosphodiester phosphodiesterase family protein [Roseicyclus marinus]
MPSLPGRFTTLPIAHRALHDAASGVIENSPAAIDRAVRAGYGIEIDLQLSADGVPMVFHDDTLDRLTAERGSVRERTARDLGQIRLKGSEDRIPTLAAVLDRIGGAVPLLIELKDQSNGLGEADTKLEEATAALLADYAGDVAVMSFNPHMVAAMQRIAPDLPRGLTTCGYIPSQWPRLSPEICAELRSIPHFDAVGASFISHDWHDLDGPRVAELKAQGVPILCWTVKSPEAEVEARRVADNVTFEGYLPPVPATGD